MTTVRLASASPRRAALLTALGVDHEVQPTSVTEDLRAGSAEELARSLARAKALEAGTLDGVVLAADTVVSLAGSVLGKPSDEDHARRMLAELSGCSFEVVTGICVADAGGSEVRSLTTSVTLRELEASEVDAYVSSGAGADKAGALELQGAARDFIACLDGCATNTYGLPLCLVAQMLQAADVSLANPPGCAGTPGPACPEPDLG